LFSAAFHGMFSYAVKSIYVTQCTVKSCAQLIFFIKKDSLFRRLHNEFNNVSYVLNRCLTWIIINFNEEEIYSAPCSCAVCCVSLMSVSVASSYCCHISKYDNLRWTEILLPLCDKVSFQIAFETITARRKSSIPDSRSQVTKKSYTKCDRESWIFKK